jgi:predicted Zn-dependent peptidase
MHDDRRYALALLAQIMGGGMSSRLFDEVREKRGLAYYVNAGASHDSDTGTFEVGAGLNRAKAVEGVRVILDELKKVASDGVTALELSQVQDQAEGRLAFTMESTAGVAEEYGSSLLFRNEIVTPEEEIARLRAVTRDDVRAVAEQIFHDKGLNLAVIGPQVNRDQFAEVVHF